MFEWKKRIWDKSGSYEYKIQGLSKYYINNVSPFLSVMFFFNWWTVLLAIYSGNNVNFLEYHLINAVWCQILINDKKSIFDNFKSYVCAGYLFLYRVVEPSRLYILLHVFFGSIYIRNEQLDCILPSLQAKLLVLDLFRFSLKYSITWLCYGIPTRIQ